MPHSESFIVGLGPIGRIDIELAGSIVVTTTL
jgi:hypothetical protein